MSKFSDIINSEKTVLLDFSAEWCGPCKMMTPILKEVKDKLGEQLTILKIDIDKNREFADSYNIRSVPTLMIFKNGNLKWQESGVKPAVELEKIIHQFS
ncbi:thioredoxin [Apibacter sp. HY039]|uniref:thioredoxin n=1 Tax=Apibacter sp. HY039 TaxID=2501476 RepID=UPI000FEBEB6F|nr:thioredoxin [Apibacter sp. HY039]